MRAISVRELHRQTRHSVRSAQTEPVVITERGRTIAILQPPSGKQMPGRPFPRRTLKALVRVKSGDIDSTQIIAEDRDRE